MAVNKTGKINLDSAKSVFYSGQSVSGSVEFQFKVPVTLSVLHVTFLGEAIVDWSERETETYNGRKRYKNVSYLGREEYVNVTHILAGSFNSAPIQLSPGSYKYPFSFVIPPRAPSTFKGGCGRVDYVVKVNMLLHGNPIIEEVFKHIAVVAPFDLNLGNEKVKRPLEMELEQEACGCFCSSNFVTVHVRLPVAGYCPGQVMPVEVNVDNRSGVEILKIILQLIQKERYTTQRPPSEYIPPEKSLLTTIKGPVLSRTERTFNMELKVPDIVVPNLENCTIIDVGYFIKATVKLSGCNSDMEDETEMCLGLLPLTETIIGTYIHPMSHSLPDGPVPDVQNIPPQEQFPTGMSASPNMNIPFSIGTPVSLQFDGNTNTSYSIQMSRTVISSDPSQNYHIGFSSSGPGTEMTQIVYGNKGEVPNMPTMPTLPNQDLRIHLPPYPLPEPSAPPPSS